MYAPLAITLLVNCMLILVDKSSIGISPEGFVISSGLGNLLFRLCSAFQVNDVCARDCGDISIGTSIGSSSSGD